MFESILRKKNIVNIVFKLAVWNNCPRINIENSNSRKEVLVLKFISYPGVLFQNLIILRGVTGYLKLGGQVLMRHAAAAQRRLLFCQNLGEQLPPCTPFIDAPVIISKLDNQMSKNWKRKRIARHIFESINKFDRLKNWVPDCRILC